MHSLVQAFVPREQLQSVERHLLLVNGNLAEEFLVEVKQEVLLADLKVLLMLADKRLNDADEVLLLDSFEEVLRGH